MLKSLVDPLKTKVKHKFVQIFNIYIYKNHSIISKFFILFLKTPLFEVTNHRGT